MEQWLHQVSDSPLPLTRHISMMYVIFLFTFVLTLTLLSLSQSVYDSAKEFRFAEMRGRAEEVDQMQHQMVSLDPKFLLVGHGRSVW